MEFVLISLLVVIVALLILLFLKIKPSAGGDNGQLLMMQQQVEALRNSVQTSLQNITDNLNQQLNNVTTQLQSQASSVGNRLDSAARVIGEVQKNLGQLGQATQEIKELGQSVSKLDELLRAPKLRGGLGESMLEDLLKQVLPSDAFEMQYRFRSGQSVDAIVRTSDNKLVPIDAKFPLENFRKMLETQSDQEKKPYQKAFINDVKKHIDSIAAKYIVPDEGTFDFALMYIPAENVYYETIIKDETLNGASVYAYALEKKVIPVSPNSFYAYLRVIALGLRGLQIERNARAISDNLKRLGAEITKVREAFDVVGSHIENARKKYEEAEKRLTQFEDRLENVAGKSLEEPTRPPDAIERDAPQLFPEP